METLDIQQLINLIPRLTIPAAVVLCFYFLYKGGILDALTSWLKRQPNNNRIDNLENFKETVETNHFHDLDELKERMNKVENRIDKLSEDIAYIKGKIGNGYN